MCNRYTELLIDAFDKLSEIYVNKFTYDLDARLKIQSLVNLWGIKRGSTILEVGGGTGDLTPFLLEEIHSDGKLYFLDISSKMVEKAKKKLRQHKNVNFIVGDIHTTLFTQKFDTIVIFNTFPHFIDKKAVLENCYNSLRKGGKLIISHNNSRWSIVGHHKKEGMEKIISDFPEDSRVCEILENIGYIVEVFENNEGYDYYLVLAKKG